MLRPSPPTPLLDGSVRVASSTLIGLTEIGRKRLWDSSLASWPRTLNGNLRLEQVGWMESEITWPGSDKWMGQ